MKKLIVFLLISLSAIRLIAQPDIDNQLASQYYQNGDWEKASVAYRALFNQGKNPQYYDQYLNTLLRLKKYEEAKQVVKTMMDGGDKSYIYKVDYGRIFQEQGEQEKADKWYKDLIRTLPANEYAIRDLAIAFYRANAYEYSVKTLLNGRKLIKDENAFTFDLLSLYRFQKNKESLSEEYLNILEKDGNPTLLNQAKNTFTSVFESPEEYSILKTSLLRRMQKKQVNFAYSDLLAWVYMQQHEFDQALKQTIAIDRQLKEEGDRVFDMVMVLISNKEYSIAVRGLEYLTGKGKEGQYYIPSKAQLLRIRYQMVTEGTFTRADLLKLENEYESLLQEFGKTRNTAFAIRQLANLKAFYLNKPSEAETLLENVLKIPQLPASVIGQTKLDLGDIYILTGELWEAALIYGQAEKEFANEPIGQEAKFRNAKLSYYQSDFTWAKTQLDVLKSSTSQLIANDALNLSLMIAENTESSADTNALMKFALADRLIFSGKLDKALALLDSIGLLYPGNSLADDILMSKANIYSKQNIPSKAAECLQSVIDKYSYDIWADDALFRLAELYETKLGDPEKAKACYQKLITGFPGSFYVTEARKRFRNLRGDKLG